ncbi:MAG: cyclic nucleotide-binding domain-containing protein [Chloroflexi bacterium]|nr:cyclic nucleotide-binding domain-containing protein [Chloroflexota bacterium]
MQTRQRYVETLKTVGIFTSLGDAELAQIGELLEERRFAKGSVIFRQGEVGDALYIVQSGRCKASTSDSGGREKVLALYSPGDFFGEMALISGQTRSATVGAVTDATVLVLRKSAFENFLATNLQVMRQMLSVIAQRQAQTNLLLTQQKEVQQEVKVDGKIIAVFSPKGGVGRTTVAVNLAIALRQETGKPVAIVDGSLLFGDVGVMLNFEPRKSIADLLPHINELDPDILDSVLLTHASGVKAMLAPPSPEVAELITGDHIKLILSKMREQFDYVVIDTLPHLNEVTLSLLDMADRIIVVTTLEMPALKNVKVFLEVTKVLGYSTEKIMLVVNRSDSTGGIRLQQVEDTVGHRFAASIVSDGRLAIAASNRGVPVVMTSRESQLAQDIVGLAQKVIPESQLLEQPIEAEGPRRRVDLRKFVKEFRTKVRQTFMRGQAAPKPADLLFGIGGAALASISLLFLAALFARLGEVLGGGEFSPGMLNSMVNVSLWVSVVGVSFVTVRARSRAGRGGGGPLGVAFGVTFGLLVVMVQIMLALAHLTAAGVSVLHVLYIPFYGALGLLGAFLAEFRRPSRLRSLTVTG